MTTAIRQAQLEQPFLRLIHLLAHHPDFEGDDHDDDDIATMSKYVEMYIDCITTEQNAPYLFHLALKVKTVRDKDGDEDHDRVSEMELDLDAWLILYASAEPVHPV